MQVDLKVDTEGKGFPKAGWIVAAGLMTGEEKR